MVPIPTLRTTAYKAVHSSMNPQSELLSVYLLALELLLLTDLQIFVPYMVTKTTSCSKTQWKLLRHGVIHKSYI